MEISNSPTNSIIDDINWFFDEWNILFATVVAIISLLALVVGDFSVQSVLVTVTALYAFITFNQMRESIARPRPASTLAVRPHFQESESGDLDFGLKNFGDGVALNLRLKAIIRENGEIQRSLAVSDKDSHLHLEEDGFLSLSSDVMEEQSFGNFFDKEDPLYENRKRKSIELYYTFESKDGTKYPKGWAKPTQMKMEDVVKKADSPRSVEVTEIYEECT